MINVMKKELDKLSKKLDSMETTDNDYMETLKQYQLLSEMHTEAILKETEINSNKNNIFCERMNLIINAVGVIAPITLYSVFLHKGFKFEEEGVYTSNTFRNLIGKLGKK